VSVCFISETWIKGLRVLDRIETMGDTDKHRTLLASLRSQGAVNDGSGELLLLANDRDESESANL